MSKTTRGVLALLALCGLSILLLNCGSTVNRSSGLLYVLMQGTNQVSSYAIDLGNGTLSLINSNASTCSATACGLPEDIILDPTGSDAFVLNQGAFNPLSTSNPVPPSIYGYKVNSDGSLATGTDLTTSANIFTAGDLAVAMARDAGGKFLFVLTGGNLAINPASSPCAVGGQAVLCPQLYVFSMQSSSTSLSLINQTALTMVPTALAVNTFTAPNSSVSQTMLYVTGNQDLSGRNYDNTLSEFTVDSSGNLTEHMDPLTGVPGFPYATAANPSAVLSLTTAPVGGTPGVFVYVGGATSNSLSVYQLCTVQNADCAAQDVAAFRLLPMGSPAGVGSNPVAMVADPTKSFLYIVCENSNQVFGFRINATQGTLTALSPANLNTGSQPVAIAMHSSGLFLFVSNNGSSNLSDYLLSTTSGAMSSPLTATSLANPAGLVSK